MRYNNTNNLTDYSQRIDDPAIAKYIKNNNQWSIIFSIILAFVAVVGFQIYGETSSEMDNPEAFYIGLGIGGMFLLIAFFQIAGRKKSTTWDGTVVEKNIRKKRRHDKYQDMWENYLLYQVTIKADNGKKHNITAEDDDTKYNYFKIGDRVRHHKGLNTYEKQDKSSDTIIFCNACATLNDIEEDYCFRCKCPLLK
ncbi:MAG: hypothetical protein PHP72_10495 [Dysgonamonadaceae bacterium]|nr:hypothetical protein [Dysgonamonadaceae bacterium]